MKMTGLNMLAPGEHGTVIELKTLSFDVRERLMEMGLTKGIAVSVIRVAPMGDPIEIELRGYRLSLRQKEAETVIVQTTKR